jgi:hypothetical protein
MADNTRMKTMENSIAELTKALHKHIEDSDRRHTEYIQHRHVDQARFERIESQLDSDHAQRSSVGKSTASTQQPFQVRNIKLDFPRFDGSDVLNWIFKDEQFFDYYDTLDNHRLTIAVVHMEKDVVPWFQMITCNQPFRSWALFAKALEMEFGPTPYESPRTTLFKLTQTTTVADFYSAFTVLANRAQGLSPEATLDCFISGLKPDIKRDVISQTPSSLSRAYTLSKLYEDKYSPTPPKPSPPPTQKPYHYPTPLANTKNHPPPLLFPTPNSKNPQPTTKTNPIRNITRSEIQLRREKGLHHT